MSVILPVDHHATFAGWAGEKTARKDGAASWSGRRRVGVFLVTALASWILVLSPFLLLD